MFGDICRAWTVSRPHSSPARSPLLLRCLCLLSLGSFVSDTSASDGVSWSSKPRRSLRPGFVAMRLVPAPLAKVLEKKDFSNRWSRRFLRGKKVRDRFFVAAGQRWLKTPSCAIELKLCLTTALRLSFLRSCVTMLRFSEPLDTWPRPHPFSTCENGLRQRVPVRTIFSKNGAHRENQVVQAHPLQEAPEARAMAWCAAENAPWSFDQPPHQLATRGAAALVRRNHSGDCL